ncbi:DUF2894 domain-containing protein [Stenotrophomonas sp. YIM B06876]|uniref:DUF2894 domain-containing protein n=1 Tax=Stenotrophomonas sp. YIM B06876 TaxID=3060211 RepID=UPI00273943A8|nr:DUF2894 domain-containing protein [Stenotrophomonas sp. YIM B06876]
MPGKPASPQAQLEAWRGQGADRVDRTRFSLIASLAQRATRYEGRTAQRLQQRLAQLVDDYAQRVAASLQANTVPATPAVSSSKLRTLLEHIGNRASSPLPVPVADPTSAVAAEAAGDPAALPALAPLAALDEFQQLWGRIRIDSLLRQSQESISEDAGPLHSSVLLHRAMNLMRDIAPEYLQHFLAYSDALSWLEQLDGGTTRNSGDTVRATAPRKNTRATGTRRRKPPATEQQ